MRLKQLSFPFWALKAERNMDNLRLNTTSYKFFLQLGFQKKQNNYRSYNKSSFILGFRDHITPPAPGDFCGGGAGAKMARVAGLVISQCT
ncbi:MAG: hypothetical protein COB43_09855 [Oceanospirillales bacterium]|jgi:hypothetical protein|nr:MAG: hypothetical protein COB43_09855 [Oceanospirillales bacterium]